MNKREINERIVCSFTFKVLAMIFIEKIKKYYVNAKRTALLAQDNASGLWYHIFSVIELLPADIPKYNLPTKDFYNGKIIRSNISKKSDLYSFYILISDLNVDEAIDLYNQPFDNKIVDEHVNHFFNTEFVREPDSEYPLIVGANMYSDKGIGGVLPKRNSDFFVWTQIDYLRKVENLFKSEGISNEMKQMSQLTQDWLGFDIWMMSEHIGNVYLIAANPYYRDIDLTLSRAPQGIFFNVHARKEVTEKLKFRLIDKHGDSIVLDKLYDLKGYNGILEMPHEPHLLKIHIYNSTDDLIGIHGPSTFLKSIQVDMSIKQADFNVNISTQKGNKEFSVEKYSADKPITIGEKTNFNAPYYFKSAESKRKHIDLKQSNEFIFFKSSKIEYEKNKIKENAKEVLRNIINNAKDTCYVCDPYFNVNDLIDYLFYIKSSNVKLRILNCKGKDFVNKDKARLLSEAIKEYNSKPFQSIECRMLEGNLLHDRFIVTDTKVWYLGSSFSEFADRTTCIAKVPESADIEIVKEIEKWYNNNVYSISLEDYIRTDE